MSTNPNLDLQSLLNVLELANGSERGSSQKLAENQLTTWETQPNFHFLLQSIYIDLSLPLQIRWLAIIKFKNGIERYWRSSRQYAISKEEKQLIRSRVFELIDEPNKQLSIQNAQAISRICRLDFPLEWPTLFEDFQKILQGALASENSVKIYNMLLILNQIIKILASVRIGRIKPALQSKIPIITPLLIQVYIKFSNEWITDMDLTDFSTMEIGYLSLKVLRRLIVDIYDTFHEAHEVTDFLNLSIQHFQHLVVNYQEHEILTKYVRCFSKIYYLLVKNNFLSFAQLSSSTEILITLWKLLQEKAEVIYNNDSEESEENNIWEFLAIKAVLIYKNLIFLLFKNYTKTITIKSRHMDKTRIEHSLTRIRTTIFTESFVKQLTDLLINYYIKLRPVDLESWVTEPEEWTNDEVNENYEFQIRQCAENFFQDLMICFKELLVPYILNKIHNEMTQYDESNINNILFKDSIFTIFQLSANAIYNVIDFNELFPNFFLLEAYKNDLMEYKILKRRLCLLVKEWYSLDSILNNSNVEAVYNMLLNFLDDTNPNNDKVVKITALQLFDSMITGYELKKELINSELLVQFVKLTTGLIDQMELIETKNFLFKTISNVILLNCLAEQQLLSFLQLVTKYWDRYNNDNELILKGSLLRILTNLNKALNDSCYQTFEVTLPLIEVCCSEKSEYFSILSEDGFELWLTILQNYPTNRPLESSLVGNLNDLYIDALLNQTEILPLVLEILKSYSLLIPDYFQFINEIPLKVFEILAGYIRNMRDDSYELVLSIVETLIVSSYNNEQQFEGLLKLFIDSQFLAKFTQMTVDETQADLIISKNLLIFARLAYFKPEYFVQFLKFYQPEAADLFITKFLDIWYVKLDENISSPRHRKIMLLGLMKLTSLGIFHNLKILLNLLTLHFEEVNEAKMEQSLEAYYGEYDFTFQYNEDYSLKENGEYQRFMSVIRNNDPVNNLNMKSFVKNVMEELLVAQFQGDVGALQKTLVENSDQNIVDNFQYFLNM